MRARSLCLGKGYCVSLGIKRQNHHVLLKYRVGRHHLASAFWRGASYLSASALLICNRQLWRNALMFAFQYGRLTLYTVLLISLDGRHPDINPYPRPTDGYRNRTDIGSVQTSGRQRGNERGKALEPRQAASESVPTDLHQTYARKACTGIANQFQQASGEALTRIRTPD